MSHDSILVAVNNIVAAAIITKIKKNLSGLYQLK